MLCARRIVKIRMLLPDLSKLVRGVAGLAPMSDDDTLPAFPLDTDAPRYRGAPSREIPSTITIRSVRLTPRPHNVLKPYDIWEMTLESFGVLSEICTDNVFEKQLEEWVRRSFTLADGPLDYNGALTFLGFYIALSIMAINASGPPGAPWGGPIIDNKQYPSNRANEIWNAIVTKGRHKALRTVLDRVCRGTPGHPWYSMDSESQRMDTLPFVDTMGAIMNMVNSTGETFDRKLLVATRRGEFMGHVFVSYAKEPMQEIKGLMPYGIQRSAFYLPGTCVPPQDAEGFVDALFLHIGEIAAKNKVTHIFTWPLEKMKGRFIAMGYILVPKGDRTSPNYDALSLAVKSIYGAGSGVSRHILDREFEHWDFVIRVVA